MIKTELFFFFFFFFFNLWYIVFCRPTATELLKHPFFKKAKDKKYLQQTLVAIGPSLETRVQKVKFSRDLKEEYIFIFKYMMYYFREPFF